MPLATPIPAPAYIIIAACVVGFLYTGYCAWVTSQAPCQVGKRSDGDKQMPMAAEGNGSKVDEINTRLEKYSSLIQRGAMAFLKYEYVCIATFAMLFSAIAGTALGYLSSRERAFLTIFAYLLGTSTSMMAGWVGMAIAVYANSRVALKCYNNLSSGFNLACNAGAVMGFTIMSLALFSLSLLAYLYSLYFGDLLQDQREMKKMFECLAGFGLGASTVAMFGRVGGGIFTKAADVGADIAGKLENDWDEDDPRNPAVIADNVGDNVGDIAGMGSDLFGSFAGSICAALVCCAQSPTLHKEWAYVVLPLVLASGGLIACALSCVAILALFEVEQEQDVEKLLKRQLLSASVVCTPVIILLCYMYLPNQSFEVRGKTGVTWWHIAICCCNGLYSGLFIGVIAEYYTSATYKPVRRLAVECKTSAATNIIQGLALGYKSCIVPVMLVGATVWINFNLARFLGISIGAIGILMTLASSLTIDAFGPITDNAGGLAEMTGMDEAVRERTDILDAAGNTTAAIGKGFAISSAMLVALGSFGAYAQIKHLIDAPMIGSFQFLGLIFGAVVPYWFFALTMESVGVAAGAMVEEVRRQLEEKHGNGVNGAPDASVEDCDKCIAIATNASLYEMIAPGSLIVLSPLGVGYMFGAEMLCSFLLGAVVCSATMAVSASNTGGAWDNTKKFVKSGGLQEELGDEYDVKLHGKKSDTHKNAIVGDTVGDPLKDTSGPALNIVMKLMAMVALVFAPSIPDSGLFQMLYN
eukprot:CAMPEP_0184490142 /NCGR_PEP_ID=MMETSP0113_2-20130426/17198_1 /TAXON_ID=91329 /ORGANISM="Norrisiella sphaerica, Strain BC52" /LENGTH=753 /DNA_ID=CAMNT_0026873901 /DNA_START=288 /DNA_END=2549 /DNA_ORIENTATION=-